MNPVLLLPEIQEYIRSYTEATSVLAFKGSPFEGVSVQELITQIEGFRKTKKKLPLWHQTPGIYFPNRLQIEQTSSEITAKYKASLLTGSRLADITGGFGVDSYYFSQRFDSVDYFEKDELLSEIARHNFQKMGVSNIKCTTGNGIDAVGGTNYDVIFVDPARRNDVKGKVFFLSDCEPNLVNHGQTLMRNCDTLLVKTSPMLDISVGMKELGIPARIHIVAVNNDLKELVWELKKDLEESSKIVTVNFTGDSVEEFVFDLADEANISYSAPQKYLYEPNAAIMKAGGFQYISERFGISKLHRHSHLFTSEMLVDFPGRVFRITEIIAYKNKELKSELRGSKANITTRNFPISVKELRTKWKISDGGDRNLFFTTLEDDQKVVLVCERIDS